MDDHAVKQVSRHVRKILGDVFILLFGVLLPLITIGVELTTRMCAAEIFDPVPTWWHVVLTACVPLANFLVWFAVWKGKTGLRTALGFANGIAIGVALYYAILFIPIAPIALIAVCFCGIGLLPMTPLLSFIAAIVCRLRLRRLTKDKRPGRLPGLGWGIALSLAVLLLLQLPETLTRIGMHMADSESPRTSLRGIRLLRAAGHRETMIKACYRRTSVTGQPANFVLAFKDPVTTSEARTIYYRVTGIPFNAIPPPAFPGREPWREFSFDIDQGGDAVGGRLKGLSLATSRLDGSLDTDAALAYMEWTLVFRNDGLRQREARARIALPPGGVVSRLTLWIDGEEREAAFAGRGRVRQAYRKVVRRRRDPVLVTTCGPDRVLVQCFPVPPNAGEMKTRIGITAPLLLEEKHEGRLRLPYFVERNFRIPETTRHSVWVDAGEPILPGSEALRAEHPEERLYAVRGEVREDELNDGLTHLRAPRPDDTPETWTRDPADRDEYVIRQSIETEMSVPPTRVVLVVDASHAMAGRLPYMADALAEMPDGPDFNVLLASDEVVAFRDSPIKSSPENRKSAAEWLRHARCGGGCDNVPALNRAWDLAARKPGGAIVWIHGPQPLLMGSVEGLRQRWERRPNGPRLLLVQAKNGPNRIAEKLDGIAAVETLAIIDAPEIALEKLFSRWNGKSRSIGLSRDRSRKDAAAIPAGARETSAHLARLWAYDEVRKLCASRKAEDAVALACRYQLVTPVSGAVVLETQQQYREAGLEPVDSSTVPTIPEPEVWILLAVVAIVMAWAIGRRRVPCPSV